MNQDILKEVLIIQCFIAVIAITLVVILRLIWFAVQFYIDRFSCKRDLILKENWRTAHFVKYSNNYTNTYSSRDISRPGYWQELFLVYTDTDKLDFHEVIELEDGMQLHVQWEAKEKYAKEGKDIYGYKFRIVTHNLAAFVNPEMLAEGRSFYIVPANYKVK